MKITFTMLYVSRGLKLFHSFDFISFHLMENVSNGFECKFLMSGAFSFPFSLFQHIASFRLRIP